MLYAGLMMHPDGTPNVVEFNCRMGDPETEVILPLIASGFTALCDAAARGKSLPAITLRDGVAVTTVLAAEGYPESPMKGALVAIPDPVTAIHTETQSRGEVTVYHAGTDCVMTAR